MKEDNEKDRVPKNAKDSDNHIDPAVNHFIDNFVIAKVPGWVIIHQHVLFVLT